MATFNIEQTSELVPYLQESRLIEPGELPRLTVLRGGVSNRTVLVERAHGPAFVLKQALPKLRVPVDWYSDPRRIEREALGLIWLGRLAPPRTITPLLFEDRSRHLLAMEAVPQPHENWKSALLAGRIESNHVRQFGQLLGTIHRRSQEQRVALAAVFDDRSFFETLRVEPYYRYTASKNPGARDFFAALIADTEAARETLVHGDYSPKNILVHRDTLMLLDHEVIHFGDPAFDVGFALTHLLSKAHHVATRRESFLDAALVFWRTYRETAGALAAPAVFEARVVRHTLGCLLARVDGRSPLEYLTDAEQDRQRNVALSLISAPPGEVAEMIERVGSQLDP